MSTTPPKKGKKRAPPSMPTGWLPVKVSKPSTPAATGDNPMMGFTSSLDLSTIPPFKLPSKSTAGTSKTPPLPTEELAEEKPWEGDDKPEPGPLPPSFPPPTLLHYSGREDGQCRCGVILSRIYQLVMVPHSAPGAEGAPIDLLSKATSTLWDLSGISGMGKPGSYAAAAAISALATPATKCSAAIPPTVNPSPLSSGSIVLTDDGCLEWTSN